MVLVEYVVVNRIGWSMEYIVFFDVYVVVEIVKVGCDNGCVWCIF